MSEEKINSGDVFERKIKLCEDFRYFESYFTVTIFRRKLNLVGHLPWQMKNILQWNGNKEKKPASIRPNAQNLILMCTFIILIIEHTMIHMIFSSEK